MTTAHTPFSIKEFDNAAHRSQVIELWRASFFYGTPHNEPGLVIDKKLVMDDGLFFVALTGGVVVGTVMAGYDGHRGWLYCVAVAPEQRNLQVGLALVRHAESALGARGCLKINLQITAGNEAVSDFYARLGYRVEQRVSMGKIL